jgi:hypothetical protein
MTAHITRVDPDGPATGVDRPDGKSMVKMDVGHYLYR